MGSLLLVNPPHSSNNIIDTRWIGHRIRSGFSALRWSNNSGTYKAVPKKLILIYFKFYLLIKFFYI